MHPHEQLSPRSPSQPSSSPAIKHVSMGDDCQQPWSSSIHKGLFVAGSLTPPLADVAITLQSAQLAEASTRSQTPRASTPGPFSRNLHSSTLSRQKLEYVITETHLAPLLPRSSSLSLSMSLDSQLEKLQGLWSPCLEEKREFQNQ